MNEFSNGDIERICALYDEGNSAPTISALTGIPAYKVRLILKKEGYSLQGGSRSAKEQAWPQIEAILSDVTSFKEVAERTGIPYMTVSRWCHENGVVAEDLRDSSATKSKVFEMADAGAKAEDIAQEVGVSTATVHRWLSKAGKGTQPTVQRKKYKKERYWDQVVLLHEDGKTVYEIANTIGDINWGTVAAWLREEGLKPLYGELGASVTANIHPHREEALRRYLTGEVASSIESDLRISKGSVRAWAVEDGIFEQGGKFKRAAEKRAVALSLYQQGIALDSVIKRSGMDYYALRTALDEEGILPYPEDERPQVMCPCGKRTGNPNLRYCSPECRSVHGRRRQANPENWAKYTCQSCGDEFELRKSSQSYGKYCSNDCAQKHTKVKKHYGVGGLEIVFDSSYEAMFWGLCAFLKVPVERYDREHGVEWREGGWYAPDFYLPTLNLAVEIKGVQDGEDAERWAAFRKAPDIAAHLLVLRKEDLAILISLGTNRDKFIEYLRTGGA